MPSTNPNDRSKYRRAKNSTATRKSARTSIIRNAGIECIGICMMVCGLVWISWCVVCDVRECGWIFFADLATRFEYL